MHLGRLFDLVFSAGPNHARKGESAAATGLPLLDFKVPIGAAALGNVVKGIDPAAPGRHTLDFSPVLTPVGNDWPRRAGRNVSGGSCRVGTGLGPCKKQKEGKDPGKLGVLEKLQFQHESAPLQQASIRSS